MEDERSRLVDQAVRDGDGVAPVRTQAERCNSKPELRMNKSCDDGMLRARWLILVSLGSRN